MRPTEENIPNNILEKVFKSNPEQILQETLFKKYGNRFLEYRKNYKQTIADYEHKYNFDYPLTVVLELVNRCDLECVMCYQGLRNDAEKFTVNEEILDKIFDDFKKNKLSALMLSASEPLLFKQIDKVLEKAKKAEIMDFFLFTNGTLLNEKNSEMILNSSITRLFISLDAATEETYNKVRIPVSKKRLEEKNRLQKIENNVKKFIQLRNSKKQSLPLTRVSFVALEENKHEIEMFKTKWQNIVDSVDIQRETSIEVYDKLKMLEKDKYKTDKEAKYNCVKPWGDMAIYSDGTVGPCCNLVGRKTPIGNIKDNSIKQIWNGKAMTELRQGFINNNPNDTCKICIDSQKINI